MSKINISVFPKHIFWNYKDNAEVIESVVINNVILYGDIEDYKKLLKMVSRESFTNVVDTIEKTGRYKKRINFIRKVVLS